MSDLLCRVIGVFGCDLIAGRYRPFERIGFGFGGLCFKGVDIESDVQVFVKILIAPRGGFELNKFKMEAEILEHLDNFVMYGRGFPKKLHYEEFPDQLGAVLVTEWVDGVSLSEILVDCKLSVAERVKLLRRLSLAIGNCSLSAQHRDLHPGNIIVMSGEGVRMFPDVRENFESGVRIVDWGEGLVHFFACHDESPDYHFDLARVVPRYLGGSFDSLPPEVFSAGRDIRVSGVGGSAESWALGLMAVRLLVGRPLVGYSGIGEYLEAVRSGAFNDVVSGYVAEINQVDTTRSDILAAAVGRLLSVDLSRRMSVIDFGMVLRDIVYEDLDFIENKEQVENYLNNPGEYGEDEVWLWKQRPDFDG